MLNVSAYTTGLNVPSARYRVRQLVPYLGDLGITVNEIYSKAGTFPPSDGSKHFGWAIKNLSENLMKVLFQPECDITWLQKVLLSKHYTFEGLLKRPMVFDVDDAIFLDNGGHFTRKIASRAQKIICGNSFLAGYFEKYNKNIDIIPTAVDVSKYDSIETIKQKGDIFYILWTGSSSGYKFVYPIEKALKLIVDKYDFVKIKIVSDTPPQFTLLSPGNFVFEKWSPEIEFSSIKSASLGIMPISDDDQSRGKCSYKMLCYMAARLPVVVSPYGMNKEVLNLGSMGYGAIGCNEWFDAFDEIISSPKLSEQMASIGHDIVMEKYDIDVVAAMVNKSFRNI